MSHEATVWANRQDQLSTIQKMILLQLADCHNPVHGCFPSQAYLSKKSRCSKATLNRHLKKLEELGLIIRERVIDEQTKRQKSTRYFLAFEGDFQDRKNTRPESQCETRLEIEAEIGPGLTVSRPESQCETLTCKGTRKSRPIQEVTDSEVVSLFGGAGS